MTVNGPFHIKSIYKESLIVSCAHEYTPVRSLRSSNSSLLAAPFSSTVESGRAYRNAAPFVLNALPIVLLSMLCINDFKKYLKTCWLFKEALLTCAQSSSPQRLYTQAAL